MPSAFTILHTRFTSSLLKARNAAYQSALVEAGYSELAKPHASRDWQTPLESAEQQLHPRHEPHSASLTKDELNAAWMVFGLTNQFVQYVTEQATESPPLDWKMWLQSSNGKKALSKYPQQQYLAFAKVTQADLRVRNASHDAGIAPKQVKRTESQADQTLLVKGQKQAIQPRIDTMDNSNVVIPTHSIEKSDSALDLAKSVKNQHGISYVDNRHSGGALWLDFHQESGQIAQTFRDANFKFHPVRGWWSK